MILPFAENLLPEPWRADGLLRSQKRANESLRHAKRTSLVAEGVHTVCERFTGIRNCFPDYPQK